MSLAGAKRVGQMGRIEAGHHRQPPGGFTIIELMVVTAVIGILAAIAIPQYVSFRQKAFDSRAMHDLGNAAAAEEAYYSIHFAYVPINASGPAVIPVPGFALSETVTLKITLVGTEAFSASATSSKGSGTIYDYISTTDTIVATDP